MNFAKLANIQRDIAADVYPKGAILSCSCGHSEHVTSEQVGEYLRHGWPKHCGLIMGATAL